MNNNRYKDALTILSKLNDDCQLDLIVAELEKLYSDIIEKEVQRQIRANKRLNKSHDIDVLSILRKGLKSAAKIFDQNVNYENDDEEKDYFLIFLRKGWKDFSSIEIHRISTKLPVNIHIKSRDGNFINLAEIKAVQETADMDHFNISDYFNIPFDQVPFLKERLQYNEVKDYDLAQRRYDLQKLSMPQNPVKIHRIHRVCKLSLLEKRLFWKKWS